MKGARILAISLMAGALGAGLSAVLPAPVEAAAPESASPAPESAPPALAAPALKIIYLRRSAEPDPLASDLSAPPEDAGPPGARLAVDEVRAAQKFQPAARRLALDVELVELAPGEDAREKTRAALAQGARFLLVDAPASDVLAIADEARGQGALAFNVAASDTRLGDADCRVNLFNLLPSDAMLADALMQYFVARRWSRIFLLRGANPEDAPRAEAFAASARKFGLKIVVDKSWSEQSEHRRTGAADAPGVTQGPDYDVLVVADVKNHFGDVLPYNTALPRPVAGTHGLVPKAFDRVVEQWGSEQLHQRFVKLAGRPIDPRDWAAWLAVHAIAQAAAGDPAPSAVAARLVAPDFSLDGFKGRALSFRPWSRQLRQPVFLTQPEAMVSVSPQEGFLNPRTDLDTLGVDERESKCRN